MSLPPLNKGSSESGGLGSLAQSARSKKLKEVRGILLVVGILTVIVNLIDLFSAQSLLAKVGRQDLLRLVYIIDGSFITAGALFIVFGLIIHQFPVPVTVLSLVLYVGANAVSLIIFPDQLKTVGAGFFIRIVIIVALIKAIGTAVAYQKEMTAAKKAEQEEEEYE
jgi:hypothetical protein